MKASVFTSLLALLLCFAPLVSATYYGGYKSYNGRPGGFKNYYSRPGGRRTRRCRTAKYQLTFINLISKRRFPFIPDNGLVFSPVVSAAHSRKVSLVSLGTKASEAVTLVAEQGNNTKVIDVLKELEGRSVLSYDAADGPTMGGMGTVLELTVDCRRSRVTALSMIAPSPDWIIALSDYNTKRRGRFVKYASGYLRIYDAGTDKGPATGSIFTPPGDLSLDRKQVPQDKIRPLSKTREDPGFNGAVVGKWFLKRIA